MADSSVELIVSVVICSCICLILFALARGEAQERQQARIAERAQSVPERHLHEGRRSPFAARSNPPDHARERQTSGHPLHQNRQQALREELRRIGFTRSQIERLLTYRAAYRAGGYQPDPLAPRRLAFARWLYQQGRISG